MVISWLLSISENSSISSSVSSENDEILVLSALIRDMDYIFFEVLEDGLLVDDIFLLGVLLFFLFDATKWLLVLLFKIGKLIAGSFNDFFCLCIFLLEE